jgi:CubicO group peptidase (beta-lactamase class C family)
MPDPPVLPDSISQQLQGLLERERQHSHSPSIVAAVAQAGSLLWFGASGAAAPGTDPTPNTPYRIGSLTKIFTAALVLQLRDQRRLELDEPIQRYVSVPWTGDCTVRQLLSHTGGLPAEPTGPWWERAGGEHWPDVASLLGETLSNPVLHRGMFHYSNPGYAALGALVEHRCRLSWAEALQVNLLSPLRLAHTTATPPAGAAIGYAIHPWRQLARAEVIPDYGVLAPAGQLWSTVSDLLSFASFLSGDDERVLSLASRREMLEPAAPPSGAGWRSSYGLGIQIRRREGALYRGHTGSVPGFLATMWIADPPRDGLVAIVMANATAGPAVDEVAASCLELVRTSLSAAPPPEEYAENIDDRWLGVWYWDTLPFALQVDGAGPVHLKPLGPQGREGHFRRYGDGTWRGIDGYFAGEVLQTLPPMENYPESIVIASARFFRAPMGHEFVSGR